MTNVEKLISESRCASLTEEEEIRLFTIYINKASGWQEARDCIIESCLLYVAKCAYGYSIDSNKIDDLFSEGVLGLLESIDRFQLNKGARFLTFASFSVKGKMSSFICRNYYSRVFSIPRNISSKVSNIKYFIEKIETETGEAPDKDAISKQFNFDEASINLCLDLLGYRVFSLNSKPDDEDKNFQDFEDSEAVTPDLNLENKDTAEMLRTIISNLPERQRLIINKRFGFIDGDSKKLSQIGEELALSKQRVNQIEIEALDVIRKEMGKLQYKSNIALYAL
jgi:RNA polymerase sigma factor (sigma-70 family)